jgi:hypothetical protein
MIRHLDCAFEIRKERSVFGFFIVESTDGEVPQKWQEMSDATLAPDTVSLSLPHRTSNQRQEIMTGFLGITTWQALCQKLDIGRNLLINDLSQDDDVEPRKK